MSAPPTVIIADPDPIFSSILRVEFTRAGFSVLLADSGQEAEDYAGHTVAQLIVLDTRLQMQAYAACARIRRRPGYEARPIILTTNELSPKIQAAAEASCATVIMNKPYSINDIFRVARGYLLPDDPLLTHRAAVSGARAPSTEWLSQENTTMGGDAVLSKNAQLLRIVRGKGMAIPLIRRALT